MPELYTHPNFPGAWLVKQDDGDVVVRPANSTGTPIRHGPGWHLFLKTAARCEPPAIERVLLITWSANNV